MTFFRGSVKADCRRCKHFKELRSLPYWLYESLVIKEVKWGVKILGWCETWKKPITYYVGYCRRFTPRINEGQDKKIEEFLE